MSAAAEFPPIVIMPERARGAGGRLSLVTRVPVDGPDALLSPCAATSPCPAGSIGLTPASRREAAAAPLQLTGPLRLTRRGAASSALAVAVSGAGLLGLAWLSAPPPPQSPAASPVTVTVHAGDTLWSVAQQVAPNRDPRDVVDDLLRANHLTVVDLTPGQVLRTR